MWAEFRDLRREGRKVVEMLGISGNSAHFCNFPGLDRKVGEIRGARPLLFRVGDFEENP